MFLLLTWSVLYGCQVYMDGTIFNSALSLFSNLISYTLLITSLQQRCLKMYVFTENIMDVKGSALETLLWTFNSQTLWKFIAIL